MNREAYLERECVRAFIEWLRPRARCEKRFDHHYRMLRPARDWRCSSLWEAHEKYRWRGEDFAATQEKLDGFRYEMRAAKETGDNCRFVTTALEVLKWGGVAAHNSKKLCELGDRALRTFSTAACRLKPSGADTSLLGAVKYMNSGWTKVYALMLDDFPIYDGRVGAAMGYLVRQYCAENRIDEVPELLRFRWLAGKGNHNRNPSAGSWEFSRLNHADPRTWVECNVRAAWILGEVRYEGRFGELDANRRLRALEAALFMIGYELPCESP